ncbi:MAG: hypothetical protein H8E26_14850 [FCB group bacterium]|nr:hypothetical protein [FCB group bacterium]MBL7029442.1 hypothetical protein [Candidatus Neomarinimicrobiota bacterium]MBL7123166.1 hypothetical protein [Candidatus Neomarinimicrobiota bacterium]
MLVAVLMIFVVFSFTGVAVLNVSYLSVATSAETVNNIKLQYATESSINEALWLINTGVDSLVNSDVDGIATVWDASLNILSVNVDKFQMETEILLDLSDDTHFDRGIAAEEAVTLDGYDPGLEEDNQVRGGFNFLPEADLQYFLDNATTVHTNSWKVWSNNTFPDGIHVFTGNFIALSDIRITSGTLVFTGHNVSFWGDNEITAPAGDTTSTYPAVIFTNPDQDFDIYSQNGSETIVGAIYCKGNINIQNGNISGPVIGRNVTLNNHFNLLDAEHGDRYRWTKGFGNRSDYDWPKQIGRWKTNKWGKKHTA